jgi:diadenosine tetraphosphate (Ap4A) HIT family hydrolase
MMVHATLTKFGYPETVVAESAQWALLVRPAQVTLGSLVLCAKSEALAYGDLPAEAFGEQREMVALAERLLREFVAYDRINYLMLMMVDPHVHFHVLPRYEGTRAYGGSDFPDSGWPGVPNLKDAQPVPPSLVADLRDRAAKV